MRPTIGQEYNYEQLKNTINRLGAEGMTVKRKSQYESALLVMQIAGLLTGEQKLRLQGRVLELPEKAPAEVFRCDPDPGRLL